MSASLQQIRMAVFHDSSEYMVASVVLAEQSEGRIKLSVHGDRNEAQVVSDAAQEAAACVPSTGQSLGEKILQIRDAISTRLIADGFKVKDLPSADFSLALEFDAKSGRLISNQTALHEFARVDQSRVRELHAAIEKIFEKGPIELAAEIKRLVDVDNHIGAADAVKAGRQGMGFFGILPSKLHDALQTIRVSELDAEMRKLVRQCRMAVAAGQGEYDSAEIDASALLKEEPVMDIADRMSLENVIAVASAKRGEIETALSIWRRLLKTPENLKTQDRAWAWRNLSMSLPTSEKEAVRAARLSVDAFLEAGDKREAATGLMRLSQLLEHESPTLAIKQLDDMLVIIDQNGLIGTELRAAIFHARGNRFRELRNHPRALEDALKAIELRRGVTGVEEELISSLHLAAIEAVSDGKVELAQQLEAEALTQETAVKSFRFTMARRIAELFSKFDRKTAEAISADARLHGDMGLIASAGVAIAISDPDLDTTSRLRQLEEILRNLSSNDVNDDEKQPVLMAIAGVLRDDNQYDRAAEWLRRVLERHPFALDARDMLVDCLWRDGDWGNAAIFLKSQLDLHGEQPGLLFAYGKSLVEAGDLSGAIPVLSRALKLTNSDSGLYKQIEAIREHALELGGTIPNPPARLLDLSHPVLRDDLELALREFANFIAADKRMVFWTRPEPQSDYKWIEKPEKRAQDLLHTFLKARFQTRISLFEELDTGAGRLDLYLQLNGGLSVIIELKMCGFGYSSTYAASGEGQIRHYMENRSCHLGYLVAYDARLEYNGSNLIQGNGKDPETVFEIFVDVRPRVSSRKKITTVL